MEKYEPDTINGAGLGPEEFLVLHIGDQFSSKTISDDTVRTKDSEMWFFQVADRVPIRYAPYTPRGDDGTEINALEPQTGVNYQRLYDSDGEDILRVENNAWRVYHFSLGVRQDDIRVYPRIPDNQNGGGFDWLSGSQPNPQQGEPFGYTPGYESHYENPAVDLETISWYTSSRSVHQYGFYNESTQKDLTPTISIEGWAYELRPVEERDEMLRLLADLSRPKGKRNNAVRRVQFSKAALRTFSFNIPDDWRDVENNLNVSRVNLPDDVTEAALTTTRGNGDNGDGDNDEDTIDDRIPGGE